MSQRDVTGTPVDERDSNWEDRQPTFRIYIQSATDTNTSASTATYDLTGVNVIEAIEWARRNSSFTDSYAVALVYDDAYRDQLNPGCGRGLVWLLGHDANDVA